MLPLLAFAAPATLPDADLRVGAVRLTLAQGDRLVSPALAKPEETTGTDAVGPFQLRRIKLAADQPGTAGMVAELQLRRYANGVVVGSLAYQGPQLAADHAVQVLLQPQRFGRGMALARYNPYWTGPVFGSDYRFFPEHGVLALWQQAGKQPYHLLVPLAGEGLVGEVGVANDRFGVSLAAGVPATPHQLPLFAYASGPDPYQLPRDAYATAFKAAGFYGRLRWEKPYPEAFRWLGWCSWNAFYDKVTEQDVLASAASLRRRGVPVGSMLVDDGWLTTKDRRLAGLDADATRFPHGLGWLAGRLRRDFKVKHVGVWHALQGYWAGVDPKADPARGHALYTDRDGEAMADPRAAAGQGLYDAWYAHLAAAGIDFVKVDNQAGTTRFVERQLPLFSAAQGLQHHMQEAAAKRFGPNVLNCMEQRPEHVYNWRFSNLARTSNDYEPDEPLTSAEHVFQNAYNSYWLANFAYPDYDMFVSGRQDARFHAIARAVSGGPAYVADKPGEERPALLRQLVGDEGRLLQPDEPAQVTRDTLLVDPGLEAVPLKLFAPVRRPGYRAALVAAFHVNKSRDRVAGTVRAADAELPAGPVACWSAEKGLSLMPKGDELPVELAPRTARIFSLAPVQDGFAVLGLVDKLACPAAVRYVRTQPGFLEVALAGPGQLGMYLARRPRWVAVDGPALPEGAWRFDHGYLGVTVRGRMPLVTVAR